MLPSTRVSSEEGATLPNNFKDRARTAFDYVDVEFKGSLTKRQYKIAMTAVFGCRPVKTEVKQVFQSTERISYELFELWVSKKCFANDSQANTEVLFALLDRDFKGYLVLEDFCSASKAVDLKVQPSVWQMVFKELDRQRKGHLGFDEFLCILPAAYECTAR